MKKFLSIFIAVAMVMSFAGVFAGAPTAMAATDTVTITDDTSALDWYNPVPAFGAGGTVQSSAAELVYKMGDTIHGYIGADTPLLPWQVQLVEVDAASIIDTVDVAAGGTGFTMGTGNVSWDGEYYLNIHSPAGEFADFRTLDNFFIQYNLTWGANEITICDNSQTISGWITRGNGQTVLVPVTVSVAYPNDELAGFYTIAPLSSVQFTITFPIDPTDPATYIGNYNIYLSDGYAASPGNPDNDAMIYDTLSNVPATSLTLSTYVSPTILYKDQINKPNILVLTDQDGNYVDVGSPANPIASFTVEYTNGDDAITAGDVVVKEISKGFYRFVIDTTGVFQPDMRFVAHYTMYSSALDSNMVIITLRDLGVFNPYVDVNAIYSIAPYGTGPTTCADDLARDVYDKLPCTIGNALEIAPAIWDPIDPCNWYVYDLSTSVDGPVIGISSVSNRYLIEKAGKITASIDATMWERSNLNCDDWCTIEPDPTNACCHEYSKSFEICEVASCTVDKVSLANGEEVDETTIEVGKKSDFVVSIGETGAPADLWCGCNYKVVHVYMTYTDGERCSILPGAFTIDTYGPNAITVDELWWNEPGAADTGIPDLPITFDTSTDAKIVDNCTTVTFYGLEFNYVDDTDCDYHLVVQVFGTERTYDACGNMDITYPMISESVDDIDIIPVTTELSSTAVVTEGALDPDEILAGVFPTIDITDPGFSLGTPAWSLTLNGSAVAGSVSTTDTGYRIALNCPLDDEGTFEIYGYAYGSECATMEEVTIDIPVIKPEFTVQIGLLDGSVIDNDGIITEGFSEDIYVTATDPRGIHDFSTDSDWTLEAYANYNDCGLPTSVVCYSVEGGCEQPSPITVTGYDNPNINDDPTFDVYFVVHSCANIYVDTFTLVPPTVTVDPEEVPFTIPASATHVTFDVTDAHAHGAPGVDVVLGEDVGFSSGAAGYGWAATAGTTGADGEVDWAFVPPYSGRYVVGASFEAVCVLPCGWYGIGTSAIIEAVYEAPALDTEAPVVTATAGGVVEGAVTINGTVEDNVGVVSLYIGAMKVDFAPDGAFSAVVALSEGENVIKVVAFDAAGNKGEVALTVDYAVPEVTVVKVQIGSDVMTINGQIAQLDAVAEIKEGHTYLPLRAIAEALGSEVTWIPETMGITLVLGDNTVGLQIGNVSAVVNGNVVAIFPPYLKPYGDGTFAATMVPVRLISEAFGAEVGWDPALRLVTITLVQP